MSRAGTVAVTQPPASLAGRAAFTDLERWLCGPPSARLGLAQVERESERQGRELLRVMLQSHVDGRGEGDLGPALAWDGPAGAVLLSHRRRHTRRLVTIFGEVRLTRLGYGARGQPSIHPLDAELALPGRAYSYELCRRLVRAAVCGPFDEALRLLAETTGVDMPKRSAEQVLIEASVDFDGFYAQRAGPPSTDAQPEPASLDLLVGAIDGKGIPMVKPEPAEKPVRLGKGHKRNKKRMATVAAVFSQTPRPRTPEAVVDSLFGCPKPAADPDHPSTPRKRDKPTNKRVWASLLRTKDSFIGDVKAEMTRRDPTHQRTWVIVTDGERALQRRVCQLIADATLVLDLLHVLEKLWDTAHAFHPEGSAQAEDFVRQRALRILRGQASQVVKGLRQMVTKRKLTGSKRKTVLNAAGYYHSNRTRMRYHEYLQNGWPIASGSVEGACKNLVKDRMERSGMRWTPPMAEAMLRLRATHLSGDFDDYWDYHVQQDQQRLHPHGQWRVVQK